MKGKLLIVGTLLIGLLVIIFIFSALFTATTWYTYILIYLLLIYIWYKPMLVLYHSLRAGHMLKKKEYDAVSEEYRKISRLKKNEGYGDYALGLAYYYQKNFTKAREAFETALERGIKTQKKSMEPLVKIALITTNIELKKWKSAQQLIEDLETDMEKGKKLPVKLHAIFYPIKGEFLYHHKEEESAIRAFELGYLRYPELMGEEAFYYAKLLLARQKNEEAKEILSKLLSQEHSWKFFRIEEEEAQRLLVEIS